MRTRNDSFVFPTIAGAIIAMIIANMMDLRFGEIVLTGLFGALAMQVWRLRQQVEDFSEQLDEVDARTRPAKQSITTSQDATVMRPPPQTAARTTPAASVIREQLQKPSSIDLAESSADAQGNSSRSSAAAAPAAASTTAQSAQPSRPAAMATTRRVYVPPPPSAFELQLHSFWNWIKTRNPIALAAVAISFLGGVFLVKYAAEHSHFPIEYRFIALSVVTIAAVVLGWRIHSRNNEHRIFAQVLQGGGIAGLYLTVFAATRLYQLLPPQLAFILMACVAVTSAVLAVAQNALPLAIIGTVGGFLTPILVSTGSGNHIALFTYYALLNVGVFTVAWFRTWRVLNVLSFAFTFSITALWRGNAYQQQDWWSADLFLLLFFLMFVGISILNALRQPPNLKGYVSGSLVFGLPVAAFSLHASLVQIFPYALAGSALGLALFYCLLALTLHRQANSNFRLLVEAFAALAVIFASLAIPLAFNRHATAAMWSFEGAGMIWLGLRTQRKLPRFFGLLLQVSAGFSYLHVLVFPANAASTLLPIINGEYLGSVLLCGTAWFSAWLLHLHERNHPDQPLAAYEQSWSLVALWAGCGWWLLGGLHEIATRFNGVSVTATLVHAAVGAGVLWFASQRWSWRAPAIIALLTPAAGMIIAFSWLRVSLSQWHPFAKWGFLGWPLLLLTQYALLWLADTRSAENSISRKFLDFLHTGTYLVLTFILAWEAYWQCSLRVMGVWPAVVTVLIPAMMLWSLYSPVNQSRWPMSLHNTSYRIHAGTILGSFILLWLLVTNLSNMGDPAVIRYIPILNPLDITSLLLFIIVTRWWQTISTDERQGLWHFNFRPVVLIAGLLFVWMNAALIRTLHYCFNVPLEFDALFESTLVQTTLSIFWMLLTLIIMVYASRKLMRSLWIAGFVLMIIVIIKMLLIDLSGTGTLARIVSFLTVGPLLFVVSYLSPRPPAIETEASAE